MNYVAHKAVFFFDEVQKKNVVTACRIANYNQLITKVDDWDSVTCKRCLLAKDDVKVSTVNLI